MKKQRRAQIAKKRIEFFVDWEFVSGFEYLADYGFLRLRSQNFSHARIAELASRVVSKDDHAWEFTTTGNEHHANCTVLTCQLYCTTEREGISCPLTAGVIELVDVGHAALPSG